MQAQSSRNSTWDTLYEVTDPEAATITVRNLTHFMEYVLRLVANNVVGPSPPSEPTKRFLAAVSIEDHNANAFVLEDLEEFTIYQVIVQAYNDVGSSQPSPPATERTREAGK